MNTRAIVLGAIIGLAIALVQSCGGPKCAPANCNGCCDSAGKCVAKPNSANNATCGSQSSACVDCSASLRVCDPLTFTCIVLTGGGTGGSGGCDGCRLPSGTCLALQNTSINNCGANGAPCAPCSGGSECDAGTCSSPLKRVGDPCSSAADCLPIHPSAICKLTTSARNAPYVGGYCTLLCSSTSTPCPAGSLCVGLQGGRRYGETDRFCWDLCNLPGDGCRTPGYQCYPLQLPGGASGSGCWISPVPIFDAGPPADKVGSTCTVDSQCQNPPDPGQGGACVPEVCRSTPTLGLCPQDGGSAPSGYTGGYCTRVGCFADEECSADGGALCLRTSAPGEPEITGCYRRCSGPYLGQSDCRVGYSCTGYTWSLNDGGTQPSTDGYCDPNCNNLPSYCGRFLDGGPVSCSPLGYCNRPCDGGVDGGC